MEMSAGPVFNPPAAAAVKATFAPNPGRSEEENILLLASRVPGLPGARPEQPQNTLSESRITPLISVRF